jgi:RimJ/RimL family protein N-acetyltransferase
MTGLRPVEEGDLKTLDVQREGPDSAGEFAWFGFSRRSLRGRWDAKEMFTETTGILAVVDDENRLVGEVSWVRMSNGPPPNAYCWNVGIWILPDERGKGHGSEAQRQAAAYLFAHTTLERVEASTEAGNVGEQRALEKAGFTREGVLRRACFRGGEWRDMVMFSMLRGEP